MSSRNNIAPQHIVLAFSGGLDTSVALVWLKERYNCRLTAFIANLGQGAELDTAARKAEKLGADEVRVDDLRGEFARDYAFPMYRANALYEGQYMMGSSIGRPLIAAAQLRVVEEVGADAVAHGATGKGNDQIRFEMTLAALRPDIMVISPWREWDLSSRSDLLAYARQHGIELDLRSGDRPYSIDSNLLHTSYEGEALEDPEQPAPEGLLFRVRDLADTQDEPETVEIHFQSGNPVGVNGTPLSASAVLETLDQIGRRHGIGRLDIVENRIFGMKTRNIYEAPSGSLLWHAHRAVESLVLDPEVAQLKEELMPKYSALVYRGLWFAPERLMLQTAIDFSQQNVTGDAILRLHRGTVQVIGRRSPHSRYDTAFATFEAEDVFDQRDSSGWLRVNTVRFRAGLTNGTATP
ncbi:argininosuccinate synthase [Salinispora fenicalii]|uniref:argininosuccinate synthase n=1 Tax=Salinispora fenicalii TaxID=1137263 RepID=UPI000481E2CB|nr:argininosuccinate synthase [Salinispora fenicalii]